jgi:hypothetical protein
LLVIAKNYIPIDIGIFAAGDSYDGIKNPMFVGYCEELQILRSGHNGFSQIFRKAKNSSV